MPTQKKTTTGSATRRTGKSTSRKTVPVFRTAVSTGEKRMTFKVSGGYRLELPDGKGRIQRVTQKRIWRVQRQESTSAKFAFAIKLDEFTNVEEAQLQLKELEELGYETRIHTLGRKL